MYTVIRYYEVLRIFLDMKIERFIVYTCGISFLRS